MCCGERQREEDDDVQDYDHDEDVEDDDDSVQAEDLNHVEAEDVEEFSPCTDDNLEISSNVLTVAQQHTQNMNSFENILRMITNQPQHREQAQIAINDFIDTMQDIFNVDPIANTLTTANGTTIYVGEASNRISDNRVRAGWEQGRSRKKVRLASSD